MNGALSLRAGLALSGMDLEELWVRSRRFGGSLSPCGLLDAVVERADVEPESWNAIAGALNECFEEMGLADVVDVYAST